MKHDMLFFENKSTALVVDKGEPASNNSHYNAEIYGKQTKRRAATEAEEKLIAAGKWVPGDENGKKSTDPGYKKTKMPGREHLNHEDRSARNARIDAVINEALERKVREMGS